MTTDTDLARTASAIAEAVKILATNGAYRRALAVHHVGNGGRCASCAQRFPCSIATWATTAQAQVARKAARDAECADLAVATLTASWDAPMAGDAATVPTGGAS